MTTGGDGARMRLPKRVGEGGKEMEGAMNDAKGGDAM